VGAQVLVFDERLVDSPTESPAGFNAFQRPRGSRISPDLFMSTPTEPAHVTQLLNDLRAGRFGASDQLLALLYDDLKAMARRQMNGQARSHTLQPTALVHEAYVRLAGSGVGASSREHFLALAAKAMRCVLIDHARAKGRDKRDGGRERVELDEAIGAVSERGLDLIALDEALSALEQMDAQRASLVELRFFGGLTLEEAARMLDISLATAKREWNGAKVWLFRRLSGEGGE
jgi:RNA polymerase sigma factor (TIGR02999 family)